MTRHPNPRDFAPNLSAPDEAPSALSLENISFQYGSTPTLNGVTLNVRQGEVVALLGDSGSGKTTLLKLVAGLLAPNGGRIGIAGQTAANGERGFCLSPERRQLGMVFQDYALWPHLTVGENISFPLEMQRVGKAEMASRVTEALSRVALQGFEDRKPSQLSGGQQQRVAVARAIISHPALVLFDEPLSNLDRELRQTLALDIADLIREQGLTALYVTHDHAEAFAIADRIVVMRKGEIVQDASPEDLVARPADVAVANFLALGVTAKANLRDGQWRLAGTDIVLCAAADCPIPNSNSALVLLRHGSVMLDCENGSGAALVLRSTFTGSGYSVAIRVAGENDAALELAAASRVRLPTGTAVGLSIDPRLLFWFQS
jgi:iron(III) transport system ATP-binding protein